MIRMTISDLINCLKLYNPELFVVVSTERDKYKFLQNVELKHDDAEEIKDVIALNCDVLGYVPDKEETGT